MKWATKLCLMMCMITLFNLPSFGEDTTQTITLYVGQTFELKPYVGSQNVLKEGNPSWKSLQTDIASVGATGLVSALKQGETIVSAMVNSGSSIKEAKVRVVVKTGVKAVAINESQLKLSVGQEVQFIAKVTPVEGLSVPYLNGVTWKVQNNKIVKVDPKGLLTAVALGKTLLYVSTKDGDLRAFCEIEVINMVTSIVVEPQSLSLDMGEGMQLIPKLLPEDSTVKKVTYKSRDAKIASVSDSGYVTARAVGETQIYATAVDGEKAFGIPVQVNTMLSGIKLDKNYLELGDVNTSYMLMPELMLKNANKAAKAPSVKWKSSNSAIVSVDESGLLKAYRAGIVTITATTLDGGFEATCIVKSDVTNASDQKIIINDIQIISPPKVLYAGQPAEIAYKISPENATVRTISVKSNLGFSVAPSIDSEKFTIIPGKPGSYVVTVSSDANTISEFTVVVKPSVKNLRIEAPELDLSGGGNVLYLGQKSKVVVKFDLSGIEEKDLALKDVKWEFDNKTIKLEKDLSDPYSAQVTLLKPTNTYLEASMLEGSIKHRINLIYESTAKTLIMADQAEINLNYSFKPIFELLPKDQLRYGLTSVLSKEYDLYLEEAYIDTDFVRTEIAFETENLPALKKIADQTSDGFLQAEKLKDWGLHSLRKIQMEALYKQPDSPNQKITDLSILTDRMLKEVTFFEIKEGTISSAFDGKALIKLVSKDGNLEKKIWVTAKAQVENLVLMDQNGAIIASSSELAKQQLLEKEAADKKQQLENMKAKFITTKASELPSDGYLECVLEAIDLKIIEEKTFVGRYQSNINQLELLTLLVKAYEIETGKTAKKIETRYFSNVKNDIAERAYQLGLIAGNSKRSFNASEPVNAKMLKETFGKWLKASKTQLKTGVTVDTLLENKTSYSNELVIQKLLLIMKAKGTGLAFSTILT